MSGGRAGHKRGVAQGRRELRVSGALLEDRRGYRRGGGHRHALRSAGIRRSALRDPQKDDELQVRF